MTNHNDVKVFTKLEKALYIVPIAAMGIFIPLSILIYFLVTGAFYSAANKADE